MSLNPAATLTAVICASFAVTYAYGCSQAVSAPCGKHVEQAKAKCLVVQKRATLQWPPRPTKEEVVKRIGLDQWQKAERVAVCETAANWQHYPNGTYIGGMGMFRQTYGIGQSVTRYRWVSDGATKAEQIAIAFVVAKRFGWSAWGCGGA